MSKKLATLRRKKEDLIDGLIKARSDILNAIRDLPEPLIGLKFLGDWSVKQLVAHLIGWDVTNQGAVQEILAGQYPSLFNKYDRDWQTYNQELVLRYQKDDFNDLLADVVESHLQFVTFLKTLAAEQVMNGKARKETGRTVTIRNLLKSEASDEQCHAKQISDFRKQYLS